MSTILENYFDNGIKKEFKRTLIMLIIATIVIYAPLIILWVIYANVSETTVVMEVMEVMEIIKWLVILATTFGLVFVVEGVGTNVRRRLAFYKNAKDTEFGVFLSILFFEFHELSGTHESDITTVLDKLRHTGVTIWELSRLLSQLNTIKEQYNLIEMVEQYESLTAEEREGVTEKYLEAFNVYLEACLETLNGVAMMHQKANM